MSVDKDKAHEAKAVQHLLENHEHQIQLEWLAPYSPELDAHEDVWHHMRRRVTHNHCFDHLYALLEAVEQFHQELEDEPEQVLRLLKKRTRLISSQLGCNSKAPWLTPYISEAPRPCSTYLREQHCQSLRMPGTAGSCAPDLGKVYYSWCRNAVTLARGQTNTANPATWLPEQL